MKLVRCAKTGNIISGAAFLIIGIILMIFPATSLTIISKIAGAVMLISGIIRLIGYFSKDLYYLAFQFDFALGILSILFGAVVFFKPAFIISAIQLFMGAFVLVNGLFALQTAMDSKKFGMKYWWVMLILSIISSLFGFAMIINPFKSAAALTELIGMALLFVGAEKIFVSVYTIVTGKEQKDKSDNYIDISNYTDYKERTD